MIRIEWALASLLVGIIGLCFTVFFNSKNSKRSDTQDVETRVKENTKLNMKLDEISRSLNEVKDELRLYQKMVQDLSERVAKVEASASQAHKRLDRMEVEKE